MTLTYELDVDWVKMNILPNIRSMSFHSKVIVYYKQTHTHTHEVDNTVDRSHYPDH